MRPSRSGSTSATKPRSRRWPRPPSTRSAGSTASTTTRPTSAWCQRDLDVVGMDVEVWDATMNVNLRGTMLGCKHAIPRMLANDGGSIVNTSSCAGQFGDLNRVAYGVSKAGIDSLTRYVATLYGKQGVRCNAIAPGVVDTPALAANVPIEQVEMFLRSAVTPTFGKPDDIAGVVVFLVSDDLRLHHGPGRQRRRRHDDAQPALRRADRRELNRHLRQLHPKPTTGGNHGTGRRQGRSRDRRRIGHRSRDVRSCSHVRARRSWSRTSTRARRGRRQGDQGRRRPGGRAPIRHRRRGLGQGDGRAGRRANSVGCTSCSTTRPTPASTR